MYQVKSYDYSCTGLNKFNNLRFDTAQSSNDLSAAQRSMAMASARGQFTCYFA